MNTVAVVDDDGTAKELLAEIKKREDSHTLSTTPVLMALTLEPPLPDM